MLKLCGPQRVPNLHKTNELNNLTKLQSKSALCQPVNLMLMECVAEKVRSETALSTVVVLRLAFETPSQVLTTPVHDGAFFVRLCSVALVAPLRAG